jgi:hypothetical protein
MTLGALHLPISLDPLIAEAKRRARQRRLLLAIAAAVVLAVAVVTAEFVTRSSAAPVSRSATPGCAGKGVPAASTDTRYAFVRRDEVGMLCLVTPPPGAQPLTREPALMARLGQHFFGFPKPFAPYAQHRIWRVHSSVATVLDFEQAHPPAGSTCPCGVGVLGGPNVPANEGLQFALPPIRGRVGSRVLRMELIGLPGGWTAIRVDAVNRPLAHS